MHAHLDDEALSAALDGYASNNEQAHIEACPACRQQLEALREVSERIAAPVAPPPAHVVSKALASAVAAGPGTAGAGRLHRQVPRLRTLVAAAAAVIVVAAGVVTIVRSSRSTSSAKASSSGRAASAPSPPSTVAASGQASAQGTAGTAAGSLPVPLGSAAAGLGAYSDPATLASVLRRLVAEGSQAFAAGRSEPPPCQPAAAAAVQLPATTTPRLIASLQWRGQTAAVFVYDRGGSIGRVAVILSNPGCAVLSSLSV
jgi:hypothetical protein